MISQCPLIDHLNSYAHLKFLGVKIVCSFHAASCQYNMHRHVHFNLSFLSMGAFQCTWNLHTTLDVVEGNTNLLASTYFMINHLYVKSNFIMEGKYILLQQNLKNSNNFQNWIWGNTKKQKHLFFLKLCDGIDLDPQYTNDVYIECICVEIWSSYAYSWCGQSSLTLWWVFSIISLNSNFEAYLVGILIHILEIKESSPKWGAQKT